MKNSCPICHSDSYKNHLEHGEVNYIRCKVCDMVYLKDMPSNETLARFYSKDFFNSQTDDFIKNSTQIRKERLASIEALIPGKGRLLDIGCGQGYFLKEAKDKGWDAYGLDISDYAARHSKKVAGVDIFLGHIHDARYEDSFFDVVTLWDVLEHTKDHIKILNEVRRVLKKGGIVVASTPNAGSMDAICHKYKWPYFDFEKYGHILQFTPKTLKRSFKKCEFHIENISTRGSLDIRYVPSLWGVNLSNQFILHLLDGLSGFLVKFTVPLKFGNIIILYATKR